MRLLEKFHWIILTLLRLVSFSKAPPPFMRVWTSQGGARILWGRTLPKLDLMMVISLRALTFALSWHCEIGTISVYAIARPLGRVVDDIVAVTGEYDPRTTPGQDTTPRDTIRQLV
jgi:hypothetical protein